MSKKEYEKPLIERQFLESLGATACIALEDSNQYVDLTINDGHKGICFSFFARVHKSADSETDLVTFFHDMEALSRYCQRAIELAKEIDKNLPTEAEYDAAHAETSRIILSELDKDD